MERIIGPVLRGLGRGRALGCPTLNIALGATALSGVYAGKVTLEGEKYGAVLFADPVRGIIEAHLFGFNQDVYGKEVLVEPLVRLRDTKVFSDEKALQEQIHEDTLVAQSALARS